jgi:hypothetical protein
LVTVANGYNHISLGLNTTDFPAITQDDTGDKASILVRDLAWTASGGNLPSTTGAIYLVLTSGISGASDVLAFWSLTAPRQVSTTQQILINSAELDLTE